MKLTFTPIAPDAGRHSQRRPGVLAWMRLARVFQKIERASGESMRCRNLSLAQFDVLAHIGANEGMSQQQLADRLLVTKGNVCQLLDRMERCGLIERRPDGRLNRLFPTQAGRLLYLESVPAHEAEIGRLFQALTDDEERELLRLLRKLDRSLA